MSVRAKYLTEGLAFSSNQFAGSAFNRDFQSFIFSKVPTQTSLNSDRNFTLPHLPAKAPSRSSKTIQASSGTSNSQLMPWAWSERTQNVGTSRGDSAPLLSHIQEVGIPQCPPEPAESQFLCTGRLGELPLDLG